MQDGIIRNPFHLILVGGAGFCVATILGVIGSLGRPRWAVGYEVEHGLAFSLALQVMFMLPLSEAFFRYVILKNLVDRTKKIVPVLCLSFGWLLAGLIWDYLRGFDVSLLTFLGVTYLGVGQAFLMQVFHFTMALFLIDRKLEFRFVLLATFLVHSLYGISLHCLEKYKIGVATPDDLISVSAFILIVLILLHSLRRDTSAQTRHLPRS
jgi:hypothetical protein